MSATPLPAARADGPQPAPVLVDFIVRALVAVGLPPEDAATVAKLMVEADLTGADAHGIFRLPQYIARIKAGGTNVRPSIKVNRSAASTALVDGDNAMGHLVMSRAAETAIEIARENGIGWVGAHHSNHAGPAAIYAAMPIPHGMIGIYSAVASANHMAIWGSKEMLLGTNPLAIGVPGGASGPLILDMATTVVSYGTVKKHVLLDKPMPEGWMVNRDTGAPITDPAESKQGILLPVGGYKGSGLALMLSLLAGTLNGAAIGKDVIDFNADNASVTNTGHFILALDISRFVPLELFQREVERHVADLKDGETLPGFGTIRLPGEQRAERRRRRAEEGIPLPDELLAKLDDLARQLAIAPLGA
ncbi:Ldh family oxidoreductase [Starkeya koreensis]|uniref:Ldh family oxidoreductase n=1 Tax=Ancylobacter koreensis TaxID=266121 RepID=A0ABT0DR12_9HYPH|nr:Ldh family oxidoreductase [Ancylobacter koreensis]MCK0209718.1 Ldh family oxidoreductase [Ancylobacter koreensis]